jgi:carbon starvation protein
MVAEGIVAVLAIIATAILFKSGDNFSFALKNLTPIGIFAKGYGSFTKDILGGYGPFIAITILNAFILTTLDTATRISRYLTEELFNIKNRYFSTLFITILSGALVFSGKWNKIWPAFGASNQLVAALALLVISGYLSKHKKTIRYTLIPAIFMTVTTICALVFQAWLYYKSNDALLLIIDIALIGLAVVMIIEFLNKFRKKEKHV